MCSRSLFFLLPLIFTLVVASISQFLTTAIKFSRFSSDEIGLLCFLSLALALSLFSTSIQTLKYSCKLFHREKTFFKQRRWPTISAKQKVGCPKAIPAEKMQRQQTYNPTLVGLTPDYLSPPPKFVRTCGGAVTSQPNFLASMGSMGSHFLLGMGLGLARARKLCYYSL